MAAVENEVAPGGGSGTDPDRTGRARIRDAAIAQFGARGVAATSLKAIAQEAGVSPALILHHFGSKQGLRAACDEYVAARIRALKLESASHGPQFDLLTALRGATDTRPMLRYLARTLTDGSPEVDALLDEMLDDALAYVAEGERTGLIKPSDHPRERVVVLLLWSLGALTMHEHLHRLLGVDLLDDPQTFGPYMLPALELLTRGLMPEELYLRARDAFVEKPEDG